MLSPHVVAAQGSIYGTVYNVSGANPDSASVVWCGFLDDTDEEIRIEANIGAGYDGSVWFDDFQNYTTETAGNPYDHYFFDTAKTEWAHLPGIIPDNSFQQEDITLQESSFPTPPAGLQAEVQQSGEILISWDTVTGMSYHVYRRETSNNGLYRRIDDPTGALSNPGAVGPTFTDADVAVGVSYTYLLIGESETGQYSPHSSPVTATDPTACDCGIAGDVTCDDDSTPLDVITLVNFVFKSFDDRCTRAQCPFAVGDVNCDDDITPLDVIQLVNFVFKGLDALCDGCAP